MSSSSDHFEEFEDHTRLKHAILGSYLGAWAMIHLQRLPRVAFFDAFAGAGRDAQGNPGSPLIALAAQARVDDARRAGKVGPTAEVMIALAEQNPTRFGHLAQTLADVGASGNPAVHTFPCEWSLAAPGVRTLVGDAPLLTFLDPYGLKGLDATQYPALLAGPKDELFILVSLSGASRLAGVLRATPNDLAARLERAQNQPELFPELYEASLAQQEAELLARREKLEHEQPIARQHLQSALGPSAPIDALVALDSTNLPTAVIRELSVTLRRAGARDILTIPMRDDEGRYKYTLLHASKHPMAVEKMKESVSSALARADLSSFMRSRIRRDLSVDVPSFGAWLAELGRGHTIPWSKAHGYSLQRILDQQTAFFPFQRQELKKWLVQQRFLVRDKIERVVFPP